MKTRMYLTFDHLDEQLRAELMQILRRVLDSKTLPVRWTLRLPLAFNNVEFVDLAMVVPDPDGNHPKREADAAVREHVFDPSKVTEVVISEEVKAKLQGAS